MKANHAARIALGALALVLICTLAVLEPLVLGVFALICSPIADGPDETVCGGCERPRPVDGP